MSSFDSLPVKRIISRAHLQAFLDSSTHQDLVDFLEETNEAVVGQTLRQDITLSPVSSIYGGLMTAVEADILRCSPQAVTGILAVLDGVDQIISDTPPVDNGKSRFGNPAFKHFYDKQQQVTASPFSPSHPALS